ncbi:hypothetical protein M1N11_03155 [Peptococcaceae bacterium]|nr:hypothetical protein [Peptococcaceae bacterium]
MLYATDFADQLENKILPALKAGFIVLADRYIFTLMARDMVRGASREWLEKMYGFAPVPDLIFYLKVDTQVLLYRALEKFVIQSSGKIRNTRLLGIGYGFVSFQRYIRKL